jgi:hypothetical protein
VRDDIKKLIKFLPAVVLFLLLGFGVHSTSAQQAGQGLEISPPLIDISTDPGKTVTFNIRLRNITKSVLIATPQINDFVAEGEQGQPKLLLNETPAQPSPYSIKGWVGPLTDLRLVPQEVKTEVVTLNVPTDASPGGHYGVVRFTAVPPELEGTGVSLSASIGSLVLVRVSGNVVDKASFADFYTSQNGKKRSFFEHGPITFIERLKNDGNVHFKPTGTVRVTNLFGGEVAVLSINDKGGNVLPASIRRFEQKLDHKRLFGRYKAEAVVQYSGKSLSQSISFWVIPYKLIAIILGTLLILIAAGRTALRRYTKRAVKKAMGEKDKK